MVEKFVSKLAAQMGMNLPKVALIEDHPSGCSDVHLLNISLKGHTVGAMVFRVDIENIEKGIESDRIEFRIWASLSRLKMLINP